MWMCPSVGVPQDLSQPFSGETAGWAPGRTRCTWQMRSPSTTPCRKRGTRAPKTAGRRWISRSSVRH
eukprot:5432800-Pyramimonas_sp.AAC.1